MGVQLKECYQTKQLCEMNTIFCKDQNMLIARPLCRTMMMSIYNENDDTIDDDEKNYRFTGSKAVLDITLEDHLEVIAQL